VLSAHFDQLRVESHPNLTATSKEPTPLTVPLSPQQSGAGQAVSGDEYRAAEPDTLRRSAVDLISVWNSDRAEDIYRIVSAHMGVPLVDVSAGGGWGIGNMGHWWV